MTDTQPQIIIGIAGLAGSGKSTLAQIIADRHDFSVESLAGPVKAVCAHLFGFSLEQLYGLSESRERPDPRWDGLTPRRALQTLGTDWGRAMHPDVWVRALLTTLAAPCAPKRVVIPDVRFQNEVDAIRKAGGHTVGITRNGVTAGSHVSEAGIAGLTGVEYRIDNSSSIESLADAADALVEEVLRG